MKPLDDILVIDLTRILAGPYGSMMLADMGADVIKVESPRGDTSRTYGPPFINGESTYFMAINRNKKSIAIDMRKPEGSALLKQLISKADVVMENFRPGVMEKMDLGYEHCQKLNPQLIYCSISGFGKTGPLSQKAAFDLAIQGMSGMQDITGDPDGLPTKVGTSIADILGGIYASYGIVLALLAREKTGKGQLVDQALLDGQISLLTYQASMFINSGITPQRKGNSHPSISPYETFEAADGHINIAAGNHKLWAALCDVIGRPELAENPLFKTNSDRVTNRDALYQAIKDIIKTQPSKHWLDELDAAGIPAAPIYSVAESMTHPQTLARNMVIEMEHHTAGNIKVPGVPIKLSETPGEVTSPPPTLGEHTELILKQYLNLSDADITRLKQANVINPA